MEINDLATGPKSNDGIWMTVHHPVTRQPIEDSQGNRARIRVRSTQSRKFKQYMRQALVRRVVDQNLSETATADETSEMIAELIAGWEGITHKGEPFEYSEANAKQLLELCPWLADQINIHAADLGRFLGETLPGSIDGQAPNSTSKPRGRAGRASEDMPRK